VPVSPLRLLNAGALLLRGRLCALLTVAERGL
jgi:hypothetical protein